MSSVIYSVIEGVSWVKVHEPLRLFEAAKEAGIDRREIERGMFQLVPGVWLLKVEDTRRIPKERPTVVKEATKADTREGRILELANRYAAIPAAFDDRLGSDYSPLDDD